MTVTLIQDRIADTRQGPNPVLPRSGGSKSSFITNLKRCFGITFRPATVLGIRIICIRAKGTA